MGHSYRVSLEHYGFLQCPSKDPRLVLIWREFSLARLTLSLRAGAACLVAACSVLSTGPDVSSVSKGYNLETIDGQRLPVSIEAGTCPREIFEGELHLDPMVSNRRALYGIIAYTRPKCDPSRILQGDARSPLFDLGRWTLEGDRIAFNSSEDFGHFALRAQDASPSGGLPGPTLVLNRDGRQYRFRRNRLYGQLP